MNAIKTTAIITSVRSKVDKSLSLTVSTPELRPDEMVLFMEIQGHNVDLLIAPHDEPEKETTTIKGAAKKRSQSQRIRDVLRRIYEECSPHQLPDPEPWESFYQRETERIISDLKRRVDGYEI